MNSKPREFKPGQLEALLKSLAETRIQSAIPYKQVTWKDCPLVNPCFHCLEKTCTPEKACQKLWDFMAARGDWVMVENRKLEEKYGVSREIQIMLNCPRKGTALEGSCKDCMIRGCYVGNVK
jgi:hypothetical protein